MPVFQIIKKRKKSQGSSTSQKLNFKKAWFQSTNVASYIAISVKTIYHFFFLLFACSSPVLTEWKLWYIIIVCVYIECLPMAEETRVQSLGESYQRPKKWNLTPPCLILSIMRFVSRVKWSSPGKGVVPSPMPWCSSYWKESFQVALDYGCQIFFFLSIYKVSPKTLEISTATHINWL